MKNKISIVLALVLFIGYACAQKKVSALKGVYVVGSFEMQPNTDLNSLKSNGLLNFGDVPFNFLDNDTVILNREFGNRIFGGSVFKYELTDKCLVFTNNDKRIELPYIDDGVFRISVKDKYFTRLDLIKSNKK